MHRHRDRAGCHRLIPSRAGDGRRISILPRVSDLRLPLRVERGETMKRWLVIITALAVAACAADAGTEHTSSTRAALEVPDTLPIPYWNKARQWNGSNVDLMVADAWAGCSSYNPATSSVINIGDSLYA